MPGPQQTLNTENLWLNIIITHSQISSPFSCLFLTKFSDTCVVPKTDAQGFDSWLTSSLRNECNFLLATSDVQMMSETKFYS